MTHWLYFIFVFISFSLCFTYLSIYKLDGLWTKNNDILNFYILQFFYIKKIKLYLLSIGMVAMLALPYAYLRLFKKPLSIGRYLMCLSCTVLVAIAGFNFSFINSYIFAVGELVIAEYKISHNPLSNNLLWDDDLIAQKLNEAVVIPEIIIADDNINNQIASHIISGRNRSAFFEKVIFNNVIGKYHIDFLIPNKASLVMFQDNLYIKSFEGDSFQAISPALGKLLVRNEFGTRSGKDAPFIEIFEKEKYKNFRIHQINSRLRELAALIEKINYAMDLVSNNMAKAKGNVSYYKGLASASYSQGDSAYFNCSNAETCNSTYVPGYCGFYYCSSGYFIRNCTPTFSISYCFSLKESYYADGDQYINTANYWVGQYNDLVALFNEISGYKNRATFAKESAEFSKETVPFELGVFFPDNNIKIALSSVEARMATRYISTLIHEYLHYDSNPAEKKSLPLFFEEGLTEYFSRETQKSGIGGDINLGYPLITNIIKRLAEKIPEQDLKDVYYSKDADALKAMLDKNLGKDFFEKNEYYFDLISYMPSKTALEMANSMLDGLGLRKIEVEEISKTASLSNRN
jgi:hypothetical protein